MCSLAKPEWSEKVPVRARMGGGRGFAFEKGRGERSEGNFPE